MFLCSRCDNTKIGDGDECKHCIEELEKSQPGCMNSAYGDEFDVMVDKYGVSADDEETMPLHLRS